MGTRRTEHNSQLRPPPTGDYGAAEVSYVRRGTREACPRPTGDVYEQHADAVADLVTRGESAESLLDRHAPTGASGAGVQRAVQRWATQPAEAVGNRHIVQT